MTVRARNIDANDGFNWEVYHTNDSGDNHDNRKWTWKQKIKSSGEVVKESTQEFSKEIDCMVDAENKGCPKIRELKDF